MMCSYDVGDDVGNDDDDFFFFKGFQICAGNFLRKGVVPERATMKLQRPGRQGRKGRWGRRGRKGLS